MLDTAMTYNLHDGPVLVPPDGPFPIRIPVLALVASVGGLDALMR
jgi:hypothetical protein